MTSIDRKNGAKGAQGVKSINALRRGLDVLLAVERSSAATLAELHRQTSLPKATLLRILKTLQQAGWIERNELEGRYVPTSAAGESGLRSNGARSCRPLLRSLAPRCSAGFRGRRIWVCEMAPRC